jgi:hypothetical protein
MPDMKEQQTQPRLDMASDLKKQIDRLQSLLLKIDELDDLAKAEILAHLYPIIKPKGKGASPKEADKLTTQGKPAIENLGGKYGFHSAKLGETMASLPSETEEDEETAEPKHVDHFKAALHHASWWAGHHDLHEKYKNPMHQEEAKRHLLLMNEHLKRANWMPGNDKHNKDSGELLTEDNQINPAHHFAWGHTNSFGVDLLNAALDSLHSGNRHAFIGGWETGKYGPAGIFSQRKTPEENLSKPGEHEADEFIAKPKASEYRVQASPLKSAKAKMSKKTKSKNLDDDGPGAA